VELAEERAGEPVIQMVRVVAVIRFGFSLRFFLRLNGLLVAEHSMKTQGGTKRPKQVEHLDSDFRYREPQQKDFGQPPCFSMTVSTSDTRPIITRLARPPQSQQPKRVARN
jgi:hypothetical protein